MKKSELTELIREIIIQELPGILVEIMGSAKPKISPIHQHHQPKPKVEKVYSKNPILNQVLNETTGGIPQEADFKTLMTADDLGKAGSGIPIPSTDINGRPVDVESMPEHLVEALTKDYSALLKAADKKAKANYRR